MRSPQSKKPQCLSIDQYSYRNGVKNKYFIIMEYDLMLDLRFS
jgi:hypothetical protein